MLKLALRNLFRQRLRTLMTLSAIVFGVVALMLSGGFVRDTLSQLGEALIHSQSGHLQIANTGFFAEGARKPEQYLMKNVTPVRQEIAALPGVADVMARLNFSGLLNNGRSDDAIVGEGVEPGGEARLGSFLVFAAGRQLNDEDKDGIIIGQGVANALKLKPGDSATLAVNTPEGAMNTLEFKVVGVFQSFSKDYDARTVKIPLAAAQDLLDTPAANTVVVVLRKTEDTERIQRELKAKLDQQGLEVKNWEEINDFYDKAAGFYNMQFGVLRLIVLIMVLLSVTNSVNMTVLERVGEFGTLMAVGNRSGYIFRLVVTESALLGFFAALLGAAAGIALAVVITKIGIPMPPPPNSNLPYTAAIRPTPEVALAATLVGFMATVLASILPALHVSRRPVVEALRQNV
uniref:LolE permease component of an ABC-transporter system n=1 Tax=uncultured bacterium CSL142 TaxID=1091569 RepID=G4WVM0_9BACT|nr:LolE permease component of an ABC-transporter system [uncultured bacterium CSL142]